MLSRLADFLHAHGRRVLVGAVICAAVAGAFGVGVSRSLWPYSADDPATQSVRARHAFETSTGNYVMDASGAHLRLVADETSVAHYGQQPGRAAWRPLPTR